jgi:hypothetical protein
VVGAGWFVGFFDPVVVVSGAFDGAWAGALTAAGDQQDGDLSQVVREGVVEVLRGKRPPSR